MAGDCLRIRAKRSTVYPRDGVLAKDRISANSRGAGEARSPSFGDRDPDTPWPPRARAGPAPGWSQLAGVPPSAGRKHPRVSLLYRRDGVAEDAVRVVLHR